VAEHSDGQRPFGGDLMMSATFSTKSGSCASMKLASGLPASRGLMKPGERLSLERHPGLLRRRSHIPFPGWT
jgi:hypothetical protein